MYIYVLGSLVALSHYTCKLQRLRIRRKQSKSRIRKFISYNQKYIFLKLVGEIHPTLCEAGEQNICTSLDRQLTDIRHVNSQEMRVHSWYAEWFQGYVHLNTKGCDRACVKRLLKTQARGREKENEKLRDCILKKTQKSCNIFLM